MYYRFCRLRAKKRVVGHMFLHQFLQLIRASLFLDFSLYTCAVFAANKKLLFLLISHLLEEVSVCRQDRAFQLN